jgi:uncharacterized protein (TIGR00369 family)
MLLEPNPANGCFGCGGANAHGMRLTFEGDENTRRIRGAFRIGPQFQGGSGFVHGGIIATILDEVMGKVSRFHGIHAVTAELAVDYLRPVPVAEDLIVEGYEVKRDGRNLHYVGEIRDSSGVVLARSRGRFVEIDRARYVEKFRPGAALAEKVEKTQQS